MGGSIREPVDLNGAVRLGAPGTPYSPIWGPRLNEIAAGQPGRISRSAEASVRWLSSRRAEHCVARSHRDVGDPATHAQTLRRQIAGSRFPWKIARTTIRSASRG
jgi:hypothetical protein